jgi:hypothetical protein
VAAEIKVRFSREQILPAGIHCSPYDPYLLLRIEFTPRSLIDIANKSVRFVFVINALTVLFFSHLPLHCRLDMPKISS